MLTQRYLQITNTNQMTLLRKCISKFKTIVRSQKTLIEETNLKTQVWIGSFKLLQMKCLRINHIRYL